MVFLDNVPGRGRGRGLTAQRYINEVLQPVVMPFIQQHLGMSFQQDNTRPHVARITLQYLRGRNVNFQADWPSLSADLYPIEHCWDYLKRRIKKLCLDNVDELRDAVRRQWHRIPLQYVHRLVNSMMRQVQAVIDARGAHTRY